MKLPKDSIIAEATITQYLLKFLLEDDKSLFFAQANYTQDNWQQLEKDLKEQILPLDATPTEQTHYGNKYEIRDTLSGPNGSALPVVTIWMTEFRSQKTKFITLYPNKEV